MFEWLFDKKEELEEATDISGKEDFSDVSAIAAYFQEMTGITFLKQATILQSKLTTFCRLRHIMSFQILLSRVRQEEGLRQELIDYLTTNESFFNREVRQIEELVRLVRTNEGHIDILCAPCAKGEECYSIAIALLEAGIDAGRFRIIGIDISQEAVNSAYEACYRSRDTANLTDAVKERYFTLHDDKRCLADAVKSKVEFRVLNIFEDQFAKLPKFDYIFSRNLFIYFDDATKQKAKAILEKLLKNESSKIFFGHADLL
jgi:chemotaxis protein methyltransferase CheR